MFEPPAITMTMKEEVPTLAVWHSLKQKNVELIVKNCHHPGLPGENYKMEAAPFLAMEIFEKGAGISDFFLKNDFKLYSYLLINFIDSYNSTRKTKRKVCLSGKSLIAYLKVVISSLINWISFQDELVLKVWVLHIT